MPARMAGKPWKIPATGHKDKDHDGRCDVCSVQLSQNLGDTIAVTWDSGSLGFGTKKYTFTCIDTDYNGTGKMLFIASEGVGSDLRRQCSIHILNAAAVLG